MQDIDFDEIDRAVSSVTNPGVDTNVDAPKPQELSTVPVQHIEPVISSHPAPSLAARRSSGRFMDVVHPSSDMRSSSAQPSTFSRPESRQEVAPRATEHVAPRSEPAVMPSSEPAGAFHWPDPIDVSTPPALVETPIATPVVTPVSTVVEETATPLESPFLSDAKVEKRPLGAFSLPESDMPLLEDFNDTPADDVTTQQELSAVETEVVSEKDEEVLLLEADNEAEDAGLVTPSVEPAAEPVPEPIIATVTPEPSPIGPTSITQQYQEQPTTAAEPTGAIYDTEAYHQPLAHTKKSSSFLVIIWIVTLIIVGGGIGAGVYFFVLPLL
jgi:hypothetical protein